MPPVDKCKLIVCLPGSALFPDLMLDLDPEPEEDEEPLPTLPIHPGPIVVPVPTVVPTPTCSPTLSILGLCGPTLPWPTLPGAR
jgi:hypothetical protein